MPISLFEKWITDHGIPMVVTLLVIFLIFKYFLKRIDFPTKNSCTPAIKNLQDEVVILGKKVEANTTQVNTCQQTLISLKGFLSGVYFRNRGMDDE